MTTWNVRPLSPTGVCSVCQQGPEDVPGSGPFWQGPEASFGHIGPNGLIFHRLEVCHRCLFIAVNHPDSPYHGKIPAAEELEKQLDAARAQVDELQGAIAAGLEREAELQATLGSPDHISQAAVKAAIEELARRGALNPNAGAPVVPPAAKARTRRKLVEEDE